LFGFSVELEIGWRGVASLTAHAIVVSWVHPVHGAGCLNIA
jgi:hypothetical protein